MRGSEIVVRTAVNAGIEICFSNPGTTEIPLVEAFDAVPGIRLVLGLFEGVCTGAADGYSRMSQKPGMTLLHLGPGFANGVANLHNARRAGSAVVNLIGDHASWHLPADPPLTMDIQSLAGTVSGWVGQVRQGDRISKEVAGAISAASAGCVATLSIPHDFQLQTVADDIAQVSFPALPEPDMDIISSAATTLKKASKPVLILGGNALSKEGLMAAAQIRAATGAALYMETFPRRAERGEGLPVIHRIPYMPNAAVEALKSFDVALLIGARDPVAFFGYPGSVSRMLSSDQDRVDLGVANADASIKALATLLYKGEPLTEVLANRVPPNLPTGILTAAKVGPVLAALQPEQAIIVDEGVTAGFSYIPLAATARRHTYLPLTGGAIGQGIPCATGAALACPHRPVINLQADGSALYTLQGLWTQAHHNLNVTTLICANNSYDILKMELANAGNHHPGEQTQAMTTLGLPNMDWVKLSEGFGVPAVSVDSAEGLARALQSALAGNGPNLIEMKLAPC